MVLIILNFGQEKQEVQMLQFHNWYFRNMGDRKETAAQTVVIKLISTE